MSNFPFDRLVLTPDQIDLSRSPLARLGERTFVLGSFNPALIRLANGNLLLMARIAEGLRQPVVDEVARSLRWTSGGFAVDEWPLQDVDASDPRALRIQSGAWSALALTSLSWLLPVELSPDGLAVVQAHYDRAVVPERATEAYGIEDPRISRIGGLWYMTACTVSPERQGTTLFTSDNGLDWERQGLVLDHQNKDMLLFQGLIDGAFWAQTRPLGDAYFAYPPGSEWLAGPSINLATSPDALHWRPRGAPGIRPQGGSAISARIGGGAPPILTDKGWLSLWHGVEPGGDVGIYRTYWAMLDRDDPSHVLYRSDPVPLLEASPALIAPIAHQMYLHDVVFTTGIVDAGDHFIVASGEADLACRITHIPKSVFGLQPGVVGAAGIEPATPPV